MVRLSPDEYNGYITTGIYYLNRIINEDKIERRFPETN